MFDIFGELGRHGLLIWLPHPPGRRVTIYGIRIAALYGYVFPLVFHKAMKFSAVIKIRSGKLLEISYMFGSVFRIKLNNNAPIAGIQNRNFIITASLIGAAGDRTENEKSYEKTDRKKSYLLQTFIPLFI